MQSRIFRFTLMALFAALFVAPAAASENVPSRYRQIVGHYAALTPDEQAEWLIWLVNDRMEPACRATMDPAEYEQVLGQQLGELDRARADGRLTTEQLVETLRVVDYQETTAIQQLAEQYRRVTREAVAENRWEFQRRMKLAAAMMRVCEGSPYPFEGQSKLIDWFQAAILQQRISSRPPLPPTPDFETVDRRAWQIASRQPTQEVRTSFTFDDRALSAPALDSEISRYNARMAELVSRLYGRQAMNVDELNQVVDRIAQLGLVRIGLTANALELPEKVRSKINPIEPLDTAITLARVKVSAARRQVLRQANRDTNDRQWDALKQWNRVSQRLDTLATGPDR
jgi:hypothetical protein